MLDPAAFKQPSSPTVAHRRPPSPTIARAAVAWPRRPDAIVLAVTLPPAARPSVAPFVNADLQVGEVRAIDLAASWKAVGGVNVKEVPEGVQRIPIDICDKEALRLAMVGADVIVSVLCCAVPTLGLC